MPVCLVKLSAVSFCRSTICGLFTISTLMLSAPPPPAPPPHPAQPLTALTRNATPTAPMRLRLLSTSHSLYPHPPPSEARRCSWLLVWACSFEHASAHSTSRPGTPLTCQESVQHLWLMMLI